MTTVGILPAAGWAVRLDGLVTGSKEMLPVAGRPVVEHVAAAMLRAGADRICIVTRPSKSDLIEHARSLGWHVVLAEPPTAAHSIHLGIRTLAAHDRALVGFPDTVFDVGDPFTPMLQELDAGTDLVVGLFPSRVPSQGDVVQVQWDAAPGGVGAVRSVEPKPADPTGNLVWSLLAARAGALSELKSVTETGLLLDRLARRGRVRAVLMPGGLLDIGTPEGLADRGAWSAAGPGPGAI